MSTSEPFHVLRVSAFSEAPVAVAREDLRTIAVIRRTGCMRRLVTLLNTDAAFTVSPFDRLAVRERSGNAARVVAAEGRARGRSGWVPAAWLHRDDRPDADGVALSAAIHAAETADHQVAAHAA